MSEETRSAYYAGLKGYRDYLAEMKTAKIEGIELGEANKEKYAEEKVKAEKIENARNCLKNGLSIEMACKITGLTEDEVIGIAL